MAGIIIVTHGPYCVGLLDSAKLFLGENTLKNIEVVILEPLDSPETLHNKLEDVIKKSMTVKAS